MASSGTQREEPREPTWPPADLDGWRQVGDEPADTAVAAYFATRREQAPGALVHALVEHLSVEPEDRVPAIAEFLAAAGTLPTWADRGRIARGQAFFADWALHHFTALYLASLPSAYAAAKGVHVLWLTARLERGAARRLDETAQFLMDVMAPGALDPGGAGIDRILHVRLMHAAVRYLIEHQPGVARPADADPAVAPQGPTWAASWGLPANQEDLAGTMLTFSTVVLDAFRVGGVEWSAADGEDFVHLWAVIGHILGIHEDLLPRDLAAARELQREIFGRQQASSMVGRDLTAVLLGLLQDRVPRPLAGLAPAMARRYVGDRVADMVGVPAGRGSELVLSVLVAITRMASRGRRADPVPRWIARRLGRAVLEALLTAARHGDRVPFAIPDSLGGVPALADVSAPTRAAAVPAGSRRPASPPAGRG